MRGEIWHDLLHVRRRRWLSAEGKNIILDSPALETHVPHDEDIWLALRGVKPRTSAPEPLLVTELRNKKGALFDLKTFLFV